MDKQHYNRLTDFLDWEFGVFFHFGIRSFYKGHKDWDNRPMSLDAFNPSELDCESWIRAVKDAGATYAIMTCKHHDGFALWPSKYTRYSVEHTPFKGGKGDVVREYVDACRKYGIRVGLYYSPAQWGEGAVSFTDTKAYDDYFIGQLSELMANYGKIDYLWLDGCGSDGHDYDRKRIAAEVHRLQPDILIFGGVLAPWDDTRWIGNEDGYAPSPNPNSFPGKEPDYLPAECDMMLRNTWFDCEDNEEYIKPLNALFGNYEYSVGRGSNLLLDLGPNSRGLLNENDAQRLHELGERIREVYGNPLDYSAPVEENGAYSITGKNFAHGHGTTLGTPVCNRVAIMEDISAGESNAAFRLYAHLPMSKNQRILVYRGEGIGHKHICAFPAMATDRFDLELDGGVKPFVLRDMKAYYAD